MQKNPAENFTTIEIDPVTGEHLLTIPEWICDEKGWYEGCLLYTSPSPRDLSTSRMPSSA